MHKHNHYLAFKLILPKVICLSRHEMSLRCINQISIERDRSKTSQKYLKRDVFFVTSFRHLRFISKKIFFLWRLWDVSNTSQKRCFWCDSLSRIKHISKTMFSMWRLWYVSKVSLESICDYLKIFHKTVSVLIK